MFAVTDSGSNMVTSFRNELFDFENNEVEDEESTDMHFDVTSVTRDFAV